MRAVVLFFALCAGFLLLSGAEADAFQTLNAATIVNDGLDMVVHSMQDEDYVYFFTLSPVKGFKFNKTQLATPGWNGGPVARINVSNSDAIAFGLLDEGSGLILLPGQKSTYFVSSANLSLVYTRVGAEVLNSQTGFLSEDSDGSSVANFVSYATENPKVLQIRLANPLANDTSLFDLPYFDYVASSYYNDVAILAGFTSEFFVYNWTTKELLKTFKISTGQSTVVTAYDSERNVLYACGDTNTFSQAVLTRLDLSRLQNGSAISFSFNSSSPYYDSDTVSAQMVGEPGSVCKGLVLHPSSGQLIYALYDPPSSAGMVVRAIASTLDTVETTSVDASVSQKPVSLLIENDKPLVYVATETEAVVIKFPTTFDCPLDCSNRGYCNNTTNYRCVCDAPYFGHNCEGPLPEQPVPPVEQPYYQPIKILGRVGMPPNSGSVADEDNLYYIANCSVSIGKISKADILASTLTELSTNTTTVIMTDFGVTIPLLDPQVGVIYLIGATNCNIYSQSHSYKMIRVSMDNFTNTLTLDLPPIETAFLGYDRNGSYINAAQIRYKSSKTDNPLQALSPIPDVTSAIASVFLPRSNTGVIASQSPTEYGIIHYDFNASNTTHVYMLPYGFKAASLAADEERGKLYIVCYSLVDQATYLIVLTPELIPYNTRLNVSDTTYAKWINLNQMFEARTRLFLDLEGGQAIIEQEILIFRVNLLTHEIFDKIVVGSGDIVLNIVKSSHYDANTSTLFVTTYNEAAALYIPPPCPRNCSGHGQCVYGACVCKDEFTGDLCDQVIAVAPVNGPSVDEPVSEPVKEPFTTPIANIASDASVMPMISLVAVVIALVNLI